MPKKPLQLEEIAELKQNPHVASIISGRINFTPEFKRMAYQQLMDGRPLRDILKENGIDPEILGPSRLYVWPITFGRMQNAKKGLRICVKKTGESRPSRHASKLLLPESNSWNTNWPTHARKSNS